MSTTTAVYGLIKHARSDTPWDVEVNADLDSIDSELARPRTVFNSPTVGPTTTLDLSLARTFVFTVSQATAIAFSNVPSSSFTTRVICIITNGAAFALTFPASVVWLAGSGPTFRASGVDIVELITRDGGTTWYGSRMRAGGVIYATNQTSTGSTGEVSLKSLSLPASTLAIDGDAIRITIHGTAITQAAQVRVKFGATYVFNAAGGNNVGAGSSFAVTILVRRQSATTQLASAASIIGTGAACERQPPTETLSNAILVDVRGNTAVGGGTLNLDGVTIEFLSQ